MLFYVGSLDLICWPDLRSQNFHKMCGSNTIRAMPKTVALRPAIFSLSTKNLSWPYGICCPKDICCEKGRMGEAGSDLTSDLDFGNIYSMRCLVIALAYRRSPSFL